ncbi:MAG: helix-turn-helix domain-containing protein [Actinomycetota bacterium]
MADSEARTVAAALERNRWNKARAVRELGITRPRLERMIERHGLTNDRPGARRSARTQTEGVSDQEVRPIKVRLIGRPDGSIGQIMVDGKDWSRSVREVELEPTVPGASAVMRLAFYAQLIGDGETT